MKQRVELIDIGNDFINDLKIIGVGKEGRAVVKHISARKDISADCFAISFVNQDDLKISSENSSFNIKSLAQEQNDTYIASNFDQIEKIIGGFAVAFFIFSTDDLAAIRAIISISKMREGKGILCGISGILANDMNANEKVELLRQYTDFMLFFPTEKSFNSTCMSSVQLADLADKLYKPLYALTKVMEDEIVSNCYDWAEFYHFVNANKKIAFRYETVRKEGDLQSDPGDVLHQIFNYESLINVNPMVLKHVLLHVTAGDGFTSGDYEKVANELAYLHEKGVVCLMAVDIDNKQPKDAIQVAIFLIGQDLIKDGKDFCESEEGCLATSLPIPQFLINNSGN